MTENKLKFMIENNKLDDLINNKSEAEKLCKLETTEEVLDLLNKYDYNETKEVFERELLEILQDINLTEEELNRVTGGIKSHRRELATFLGVVSLTGAVTIPAEAAKNTSSISTVTKEQIKRETKKNSERMADPKGGKLTKALATLVPVSLVGGLLYYGGKKLCGQFGTLPPLTAPKENWSESLAKVNAITISLLQNPDQDYATLINDVTEEDLKNYAIEGVKLWFTNIRGYFKQDLRSIDKTELWNANYGLLLKIRWAIWLLRIKDSGVTDEELRDHVRGRIYIRARYHGMDDGKFVYIERCNESTTKPLPRTVDHVTIIEWILIDRHMTGVGGLFDGMLSSLEGYSQHTTYGSFVEAIRDIIRMNVRAIRDPIRDDARALQANAEDPPQQSFLDETGIRTPLPDLTAPGENWNGKLAKINDITVSLVNKPDQDYAELIKDVTEEDLKNYMRVGLELWCDNTRNYYNQQLRSITNAKAWNDNFGLLMKIRWAVWLLRIKDRGVTNEDLQKHVGGREYVLENHEELFGGQLVWAERCAENYTRPLPGTVDYVPPIWNEQTGGQGNIYWSIQSIICGLGENGQLKTYQDFANQLGTTLTKFVPNWHLHIGEDVSSPQDHPESNPVSENKPDPQNDQINDDTTDDNEDENKDNTESETIDESDLPEDIIL